jgi:hypothetical protein
MINMDMWKSNKNNCPKQVKFPSRRVIRMDDQTRKVLKKLTDRGEESGVS